MQLKKKRRYCAYFDRRYKIKIREGEREGDVIIKSIVFHVNRTNSNCAKNGQKKKTRCK